MHRILAICIALGLGAGAASAQTTFPSPSPDWGGAYGGVQYDFVPAGQFLDTGAQTDLDGGLVAAFAGYRHDFGRFVLGGEVDLLTGEIDLDMGVPSPEAEIDHMLRAGIEAGVDGDGVMIYTAAGAAALDLSAAGQSDEFLGVFWGIGADFTVTDRVILGAELLIHSLVDGEDELDFTTFGLSAAFRF